MSQPVTLDELWKRIDEYGDKAYLVTINAEATPHVVTVVIGRSGHDITVGAGKGTRSNLAANPKLTIMWAPTIDPAYCLLVDGVLAGGLDDEDHITIEATSAMLHRVAGADGNGPRCIPV